MTHKNVKLLRSVLFAYALLCVGCVHPWDGAHTALEVTAEAVTHTERMVAVSMGPALEEAREAIVEEARVAVAAGENPSVNEYMTRFDELVEPWERASLSLVVMGDVLLLAETAITAWRDMKEQPENWGTLCARIGEAQEAVMHALEMCGVTVPPIWRTAVGALEPLCVFVAPVEASNE